MRWAGALGSGLVAHLDDVGRGDPEAEPEVLAVTMSNQARPGQVKLQSKRGKKKNPKRTLVIKGWKSSSDNFCGLHHSLK